MCQELRLEEKCRWEIAEVTEGGSTELSEDCSRSFSFETIPDYVGVPVTLYEGNSRDISPRITVPPLGSSEARPSTISLSSTGNFRWKRALVSSGGTPCCISFPYLPDVMKFQLPGTEFSDDP